VLDNEEALQAFISLERILRIEGLNWVCDQVQEEIRLGKLQEKQVETYKELRASDADVNQFVSPHKRMGKGPKAKLMTVGDFSPQERLRMLIDAMQRAVVDTGDLEEQIGRFFSSPPRSAQSETSDERGDAEMGAAQEVRFVRPEQESSNTVTTLRRPAERENAIRRLRGLIEALRAEI